jgi:uncharacterized OsmC-like protein
MVTDGQHGRHAARSPAPSDVEQFDTVTVRPHGRESFDITVRGHLVTVDQPPPGGDDTAPTPTELFVASLAGCVAFYAQRYLVRHELPVDGLQVRARWEMAARPARVAGVRLEIRVPASLPPDRRDGLLAVASHCTVHNSLEDPPEVTIGLQLADAAA